MNHSTTEAAAEAAAQQRLRSYSSCEFAWVKDLLVEALGDASLFCDAGRQFSDASLELVGAILNEVTLLATAVANVARVQHVTAAAKVGRSTRAASPSATLRAAAIRASIVKIANSVAIAATVTRPSLVANASDVGSPCECVCE